MKLAKPPRKATVANTKSHISNAQLAVNMFEQLRQSHNWSVDEAWKGIALLLLTCQIFASGWKKFHNVVVYRDSNDFKVLASGPNAYLRRAEQLSVYLAAELGVDRSNLCSTIGQYWRHPAVQKLQPNNPVGNAFRSLVAHVLKTYGDPMLTYDEEVPLATEYPGFPFHSRSKKAKLDIVARRAGQPVALISVRWRFRHDRVDVVDEATTYMHAARKHNPKCSFFAVVGEFAPNRLTKILSHAPPEMPKGAIDACVHFNPRLLWDGLGENGVTKHLKSLSWLAKESHGWR